MNKKTQAFLTQLAALCDEHGVDFEAEEGGAVRFTGGGLETTEAEPTPHPSIRVGLYGIADVKADLQELGIRTSR